MRSKILISYLGFVEIEEGVVVTSMGLKALLQKEKLSLVKKIKNIIKGRY
jgi:hypothetical protein